MSIEGLEGLSVEKLEEELRKGGEFVVFEYCISIILMTFKRTSDVYFIKNGESAFWRSFPYILISLFFGWWGIPWGPIYTISSIYNNFQGGRNVTYLVVEKVRLLE